MCTISKSTSTLRQKATLAIEALVQSLVLLLIGYSWYLCVIQIGYSLLIRTRGERLKGAIYTLVVNVLLALISILYLLLASGRKVHNVQRFVPPERSAMKEPYCSYSPTGAFTFCHLDQCRGAWKPPRSHHCSVCGVCRINFDHHCPWIGNCVTTERMKAFLCFLTLLPITFSIAISPIHGLLWNNILTALRTSQRDLDCQARWWNWYGSWVFFGGPLGRWIWGTIFGFYILQQSQDDISDAPMIERPHFGVAFASAIALVFGVFSAVLGTITFVYVIRGVSSYEGFPPRSKETPVRHRYVCISDGSAHPLLPEERPYDMGWRNNFRKLLHQPFFPPLVLDEGYNWLEINPTILRRIRDM